MLAHMIRVRSGRAILVGATIGFVCLSSAHVHAQISAPASSRPGNSQALGAVTIPENSTHADATAGALGSEAHPHVSPLDLTLAASFGAAVYSDAAGPSGALFGATALLRWGLAGVGLSAANGKPMFKSASVSDYSLLAGLSFRSVTGVRWDVLGSLSVHSYQGWGASEYGTDETFRGASATVPCAGARVRLLYLFSKQRQEHFMLGGQAGLDYDLERRERPTYDNVGLQEMRTVGGHRITIELVLGAAFDLGKANPQPPEAR